MNYIKNKQLVLNEEEMSYVSVHPYDEDGDEEWRADNNVYIEYDTITNEDYTGDPERSWISGRCVIRYDNKYWLTSYNYSNIGGIRAIGGGTTYIFKPVKKKTIVTHEWVAE